MTSVLRLGVYRERIEKYGAGSNGSRRQTAQPQQQIPGCTNNATAKTQFPANNTRNQSDQIQNEAGVCTSENGNDEPSEASAALSSPHDRPNSQRLRSCTPEMGGKPGKGTIC